MICARQARLTDFCCLKQSDRNRHLKVFFFLLPLLLFKTYKHADKISARLADKISARLSFHLDSVVVYWGDGRAP